MELFKNVPITTLAGNVNNSSDPVVLSVVSAALFPTTGNFRILIGSELLKVTSVSGTDFTAVRATEGTSIASHTTGDTVQLILTADSLDQTIKDRFVVDVANNYNAANAELFTANNVPASSIKQTHSYLGLPYAPIHEFDPTGWTWFNQGSATFTRTGLYSSLFSMPTAGGNIRGAVTPFSSSQTLEAWIQPTNQTQGSGDTPAYGLCIANSSNDKKVNYWARYRTSGGFPIYDLSREYWSDNTTYGGSQSSVQLIIPTPVFLLRMSDDGAGNVTSSYSTDGLNFIVHDVYAYSGNFTADRCGVAQFNNSPAARLSWYHNFRIF